ncbi:J domain-containing protein [Nevskia soli]|uniref:J domain-containing protein n=1 Tax=Nevskia soli TaxID=418856 RepID=UPI0012FCF8D6|nr:J domain-containing protein [Nevskia soli]
MWKLLSFVASLSLTIGLGAFLSPYLDQMVMVLRVPPSVENGLSFLYFLVWALVYFLLLLTLLPPWLPDLLYIRLNLRTQVTVSEAAKAAFLFDGSLNGRWYRLPSLRTTDPDVRRDFLFRFANNIAQKEGIAKPFRFPEEEQARQQAGSQAGAGQNAGGGAPPRVDPSAAFLRLLGLAQMPASQEELKAAYRKRIAAFHPDRFAQDKPEVRSHAEEMSKRINLAYRWLYDRMRVPA